MTIHSNKACLGRLRRHLSLSVSLPCAPVSAVALTALWPKQLMKEFVFCYGSRRLRVHLERKPWQQQDIDSKRKLKAYISKCKHQVENNQEVGRDCKCSRPAPSVIHFLQQGPPLTIHFLQQGFTSQRHFKPLLPPNITTA